MIRLSGISGTKATITIALLTLLDKDRFQISPAGMSKMGLTEGSRIDVAANPEDNNALYIAMVSGKTEGRNVSKTGKVQSEQIHSWLVDNPKGIDGQYEITDETVEFDGVKWHKLAIFDAPTPAPVADEADVAESNLAEADVAEEEADEAPVRAEVGAQEEAEEDTADTPTAEVEDSENF